MDDVKATVRRYIEDNFFMGARCEPALGDQDSFLENHVLDSTGFLETVANLEETFGIKVTDDEMVPENLDSIAAIEAYLVRKRSCHAG